MPNKIQLRGVMALVAGVATAAMALALGAAPATAAPAAPRGGVQTMDTKVDIRFMNEGYYYAYADLYAYDSNYNLIDQDWSGTYGHGGGHMLHITANAAHLKMLVRYDPTGETVKEQWIEDWMNYPQKWCSGQYQATIYVGGIYGSPDTYDIHCKKL
ncbi:MAG: hypothetical protein QOJ50_2139 [Cryptosporangiaceae bacterium]|jgi:hypothetical protein|nr:hypothetical protein [Cryptosporangiaceae bacterium]